MKRKLTTKMLVFAGLLIALEILLTRFIQIYLPIFDESRDRISLGFLPVAVGGTLFGPVGGGIIAAVADIIRAIIFPQGGAINPLYTVVAALRGILYGAFLYKSTSWLRVFIVTTLILVGVNLGLHSAITAFSYGGTFWARLITKLIPALSNYILQLAILIPVLPKLERSFKDHV